ncbi:MAG: transcription elongation factor GreA [Coriobacteriales bacterium]
MTSNEVVLTQEGKEKLEEELHYLEKDKRQEVSERIKVAREFGDISENSEYDDAKNEQAQVEGRIAEINDILSNATIVDAPKLGSRASIGSTIVIEMANGVQRTFKLVGSAEADFDAGKISNESAVGAAAMGHEKGDKITTEGPTGRPIEFTIVEVSQ